LGLRADGAYLRNSRYLREFRVWGLGLRADGAYLRNSRYLRELSHSSLLTIVASVSPSPNLRNLSKTPRIPVKHEQNEARLEGVRTESRQKESRWREGVLVISI